ncbi:MAG: GNAT family N-acetyltransferase [Bacteroidota bacterium]
MQSFDKVEIKVYAGNRKALVRLLENQQDHVIMIDPMKRFIRHPAFGESYTSEILEKVNNQNGKIYFAEQEGKPVGVIIGIIDELPERDLLECVPSKMGTIIQLFVEEECRGKNVGTLLIAKIEEHFKSQNCDVVYVGTLESNVHARNFYHKKGYNDRIIEMIKKI